MPSQKLFKHDSVSVTIDIHGTTDLPLFALEQVGAALWLKDVDERILSFDTDEVIVREGVSYVTEMGVMRLSSDGQSPWSSAFGRWAVKVAKQEILAEKRTLQLQNQELMSKQQAEEWLYIIRNLSDERDDIFKIGTTGDLDARTSTLGTAMPDGVGRAFSMKCVDGKLCEKLVHNLLKKQHYKKEWFKSDLATLISCVKAAVYVGDGLVRNLGRLTDENLDTIKNVFENLGQTRTTTTPSNKRSRVLHSSASVSPSTNVTGTTPATTFTSVSPFEYSDLLQEFVQRCLKSSPGNMIHTHLIRSEYRLYLNQVHHQEAAKVNTSTAAVTKGLEALGYIIPKHNRKIPTCCAFPLRCLLDYKFVSLPV